MSKADEIELAYVHIPIFYNAKIKSENKTNTVQETRKFNEEEKIFGHIGVGMLLIIIICCVLILHFFQEREWF